MVLSQNSIPLQQEVVKYFTDINDRGGPSPDDYQTINTLSDKIYAHRGTLAYQSLIADIRTMIAHASAEGQPLHGSLTDRAANQPNGAGEFRIIDGIYSGLGEPSIFYNPTDIGKGWDRFFLQHPAAQAVRNRKQYFIDQVKRILKDTSGESVHIANVASGPITDLVELLTQLSESDHRRITVTCVDQDSDAIGYSQEKIQVLGEDISSRVHFVTNDMFKWRPDKDHFDLVWSAGLFDYFHADNRLFQRALKKFYAAMKNGGEVIIGNFNQDHNPSRAYMEVFCNWLLQHRTEAELLEIAQKTGFSQSRVGREPLDVNLFLHAKK